MSMTNTSPVVVPTKAAKVTFYKHRSMKSLRIPNQAINWNVRINKLPFSFVISYAWWISLFSLQPSIGTNPLSVAAPGKDGDSFLLDMAVSAVAYGKVKVTK